MKLHTPLDKLKGKVKYLFETWFRTKKATPDLRFWMLNKEEFHEKALYLVVEWLNENGIDVRITKNMNIDGYSFIYENSSPTICGNANDTLERLIFLHQIDWNKNLPSIKFYTNTSEMKTEDLIKIHPKLKLGTPCLVFMGYHQLDYDPSQDNPNIFKDSIKIPGHMLLDMYYNQTLSRTVVFKNEVYYFRIFEGDKGIYMEYENSSKEALFETYVTGDSFEEVISKWNRKLYL